MEALSRKYKLILSIFTLCMLLITNHLSAQNATNDSARITNLLDSSEVLSRLSLHKEERKNQLDSLYKTTLDSKKQKFRLTKKKYLKKVDSSARKSFIDSMKQEHASDLFHDSLLKQDYKSLVLEKLKGIDYMPSLSGGIVSESYFTNFQDPYTRSEALYSRLYGSPSVQILNLPFNVNFFYTTENNSIYNSNYITLDFDINRYKQNLRRQLEDKLKAQLEEKKKSATDLFDVSKGEQILTKKLEEEKAKLQSTIDKAKELKIDTSGLSSKINAEKAKQLEQIQSKAKAKAKEKATSLEDSLSSSIMNKIPSDSLSAKKDLVMDSVERIKGRVDETMAKKDQVLDSIAKIKARVEEYEQKLISAREKLEELKNIDKLVSDSISTLKEKYASKEFLKAQGSKNPHVAKVMGLASKVKTFRVGLTNPMFSEYTLNGIPVKGVHTAIDLKRNAFEIAVGKTFLSEFNSFGLDQPPPSFDRNVIGLRVKRKLGESGGKSFTVSSVSFFDDKSVELPKQNILHSLDLESNGSKADIKFSLNHSVLTQPTLEASTIQIANEQTLKIDRFQNFMDHFAVEGAVEFKVSKLLKLESSYKRVSPEYITLGNPFLRSNFHELDVKAKTKIFKRKITLTSFYKKYEDNITNLSETTNQMDGYGISVKSNFRKALNFSAQYSPYQQGNNNPDTLFRTDNQLAVTSANIIFNKVIKDKVITSILTYVNSTIDYNNGELLLNNSMYLSSSNLSTKKFNFSVNVSRNITGPLVDTLNFWGSRIGISQKNGKKVNFALNGFLDGYDSGALRHRTTLQASLALIPKTTIVLSGEYGEIRDLFGIENKSIFGSRMIVKYNF